MQRLRKYLEDTGTTQSELAQSLGVTQPTVWEWLNGHSKPSAARLVRLSSVTGISIDALLSEPAAKRS